MAERSPFLPGTVDWSGENPSIVLKEENGADYATLTSFFRVMVSPHGSGVAAVVMETSGGADALNVCITDNEPLARYLVDGYLRHFALFKDRPALDSLGYPKLTSITTENAIPGHYSETLRGDGLEICLRWLRLGAPYKIAMPKNGSPTGQHELYSVFLIGEDGDVTVNGRRLPGQVVPRDQAGRQITTAFLAFSETWLRI